MRLCNTCNCATVVVVQLVELAFRTEDCEGKSAALRQLIKWLPWAIELCCIVFNLEPLKSKYNSQLQCHLYFTWHRLTNLVYSINFLTFNTELQLGDGDKPLQLMSTWPTLLSRHVAKTTSTEVPSLWVKRNVFFSPSVERLVSGEIPVS